MQKIGILGGLPLWALDIKSKTVGKPNIFKLQKMQKMKMAFWSGFRPAFDPRF